jgi:ornithine carbamoyltransferase
MSKHLINISDLNKKDVDEIIDLSLNIENNISSIDLQRKKIGLIFEKPSTRTRLSFLTGIHELNGLPIELDVKNLNLSRNESFVDTIKMFNLYLDFLILRTDDHKKLEIAREHFSKPIINALSDVSHPCQILADFLTLKDVFKKNDIIISWFGDLNNVLFSLVELSKIIKTIKIKVFSDRSLINKNNHKFISDNVEFFYKICNQTIQSSDCIMTDVFTSMNDELDQDKKKKLLPFQVNKKIISLLKKGAVFMHCLPANIGEEVTSDILNSEISIILKQAYNRKVLQKGLLAWLNI